MKKSLKDTLMKFAKVTKKRLAFIVASPLAIVITCLVLVGSVSATVATYQIVIKPEEKPVQTQIDASSEVLVDVPKTEEVTEPTIEPTIDPNHQDLSPGQYTDTNIERDTKYLNIHDMGQSAVPECIDGWNYVAPNGDIRCLSNNWNGDGRSCNYAVLTRVKDGIDETTIGLSPGVRQGINCSGEATKADVLDMYNVICQDGTQDCITMEVVDITRNPSYTPPNGQE